MIQITVLERKVEMETKDLSVLLDKCIGERNNLSINNEFMKNFQLHINDARSITHGDIKLVLKATEIDDGLSAMYLFERIRKIECLKVFWNMVRENEGFQKNFHGRSYKFLCASMNYNFQNRKMNEYHWSQIIELIILKKGDKSIFDYERIFKDYFLDELTEDTYLPDIKKISTDNQVYEQFVRFIRNAIQSKAIRESKKTNDNITIVRKWIFPYIKDIELRVNKDISNKDTILAESKKKKDSNKSSKDELVNQKKERVIVMINSENTNEETRQAFSDPVSLNNKIEKQSVIVKKNELDSTNIASEEPKSVPANFDTSTEVMYDSVPAETINTNIVHVEKEEIEQGIEKGTKDSIEKNSVNDDLKNKDVKTDNSETQKDATVGCEKNNNENEEDVSSSTKKKVSEKKTKKTKKKSEDLKGLAEYFEKLELLAEKNAKDLQDKEGRIDELNKQIVSKDGEIDDLHMELMKLKAELEDKSRSSDELAKKLEESMEMNLSFETIKASREENLKKDIANSLRNIYEDYINSINETMDIELGEIYREKIGEIFQILEKDEVKVEL